MSQTKRGITLADYAPDVAQEFHPTKNGALSADQISRGSEKVVWWLGQCGHEWDMPVDKRTRTKGPQGCPFCSGRRILVGFNDLATTHPDVAADWDHSLNDFSPTEVAKSSSKYAWFRCRNHDHSYWMKIVYRTSARQHGCNVCSGHVILPGFNDLKTLFPAVAEDMDRADNGGLVSSQVGTGVDTRVNFKCALGHVWDAQICNRTAPSVSSGCPYCCNQKAWPGFNDLLSQYPEIARKFDSVKSKANPESVVATSNRKYWFTCGKGHSYDVVLSTATRLGVECGYCLNRRAWRGDNDLTTRFPDVAAELDIEKNKGLVPSQVPFGSHKRLWFLCAAGHSWRTAVINRTGRGDGCTECAGVHSSAIEQKFSGLLDARPCISILPKVNRNRIPVAWGKHKSLTVDILANVKGLGKPLVIEYDGKYWHRDKFDKDAEKTEVLLAAGYAVVRIRELDLAQLDISHENLLQINTFKQTPQQYNVVVDEIERWLKSSIST